MNEWDMGWTWNGGEPVVSMTIPEYQDVSFDPGIGDLNLAATAYRFKLQLQDTHRGVFHTGGILTPEVDGSNNLMLFRQTDGTPTMSGVHLDEMMNRASVLEKENQKLKQELADIGQVMANDYLPENERIALAVKVTREQCAKELEIYDAMEVSNLRRIANLIRKEP